MSSIKTEKWENRLGIRLNENEFHHYKDSYIKDYSKLFHKHAYISRIGFADLPGVTNIIFAPIDIKTSITSFSKIRKTKDREGKLDHLINIVHKFIFLVNAMGTLIRSLYLIAVFFKLHLIKTYLFIINIKILWFNTLGMVGAVISGLIEMVSIGRHIRFSKRSIFAYKSLLPLNHTQTKEEQKKCLSNFIQEVEKRKSYYTSTKRTEQINLLLSFGKKNLENLDQKEKFSEREILKLKSLILTITLLDFHNEFLGLTEKDVSKTGFEMLRTKRVTEKELLLEKMQIKRTKLARRIEPWCVGLLNKEIDQETIQRLHEGSKTTLTSKHKKNLTKAEAVIKQILIQNDKHRLAFKIGLLAIISLLLSFFLPMFAIFNNFTIIGIFLTLSMIASFGRYIVAAGYFNSVGWHFNKYNLIPEEVKSIASKVKIVWIQKIMPRLRNPLNPIPYYQRQLDALRS